MALAWSDDRLTRFTFGHPSAAAAIASLEADDDWTPAATVSIRRPGSPNLSSRLQSYAAGNDERFDDVPLDLSHLSDVSSAASSAPAAASAAGACEPMANWPAPPVRPARPAPSAA